MSPSKELRHYEHGPCESSCLAVEPDSRSWLCWHHCIRTCDWQDTVRTLVVTGRPLRARRNEYLATYESKPEEVMQLTEKGVIPMMRDLEEEREDLDMPFLMGQVAALIKDVKPARAIVEDMVTEAVECLGSGASYATAQNPSRLRILVVKY